MPVGLPVLADPISLSRLVGSSASCLVRRVVSRLRVPSRAAVMPYEASDGLPDALDLIVVCVEAGLGLDQAMHHVASELMDVHRDISEEIEIVNLEIRGGKRRMEAMRGLSDRTGEPELSKLVAVMIQTDRFGTSIADSLRTHSDFMRVRRRQEAEERAAKIGVKVAVQPASVGVRQKGSRQTQ